MTLSLSSLISISHHNWQNFLAAFSVPPPLSWWIWVFVDWATLVCPWVGVHRRILLVSLFLLLLQCLELLYRYGTKEKVYTIMALNWHLDICTSTIALWPCRDKSWQMPETVYCPKVYLLQQFLGSRREKEREYRSWVNRVCSLFLTICCFSLSSRHRTWIFFPVFCCISNMLVHCATSSVRLPKMGLVNFRLFTSSWLVFNFHWFHTCVWDHGTSSFL